MTLRIGSMCSGYGGLEMGVRVVIGGTVAWHCEIDPAASKILAHHHPDVPNHGDLLTAPWEDVESSDYLRLANWRIFQSGHAAKTINRTNRENQGDLFGAAS